MSYYACNDQTCSGLYLSDLTLFASKDETLFSLLYAIGLVQCAVESLEAGLIPIDTPQIASRIRVATSGSIPANTYGSVTFYSLETNSTIPTVAGVDLEAGRDVSFNADPNRGLTAIAYTASATAVLEIERITK